MLIRFGMFADRTVAHVVIHEPGYVEWMRSRREPTERLASVRQEAERLIRAFDARPFAQRCHGQGCERAAARGCAYDWGTWMLFWCGECDPGVGAQMIAVYDVIRTYDDALGYADRLAGDPDGDPRKLIEQLAAAKGLDAASLAAIR